MKVIELTRGQVALVDDEDFDYLNQWKWNAHRRGEKYTYYAVRTCYQNGKKTLRMHNVLASKYINDYEELDHIDRNGLNNCKNNLRICTRGENIHNTRNRGKYAKGVDKTITKYKSKNGVIEYIKYRARINVKGKSISLGYFKTEDEAYNAYLEASKKYYKYNEYKTTYHNRNFFNQ